MLRGRDLWTVGKRFAVYHQGGGSRARTRTATAHSAGYSLATSTAMVGLPRAGCPACCRTSSFRRTRGRFGTHRCGKASSDRRFAGVRWRQTQVVPKLGVGKRNLSSTWGLSDSTDVPWGQQRWEQQRLEWQQQAAAGRQGQQRQEQQRTAATATAQTTPRCSPEAARRLLTSRLLVVRRSDGKQSKAVPQKKNKNYIII